MARKNWNVIPLNGREYDIAQCNKGELLLLKGEIDYAIDDIKEQLGRAKARVATHGEYSDPDWYRRTERALRIKRRQSQRIQQRLGEMKEARRQQADSVDALMVKIFKERVDEAFFRQVAEEAQALHERGLA